MKIAPAVAASALLLIALTGCTTKTIVVEHTVTAKPAISKTASANASFREAMGLEYPDVAGAGAKVQDWPSLYALGHSACGALDGGSASYDDIVATAGQSMATNAAKAAVDAGIVAYCPQFQSDLK